MSVQLNHTIVACRDQQRSAAFLTGILGLPPATRFGHFLVVEADNGVSLDFSETSGEIAPQHYAFLVGEEEFDAASAASGTGPAVLGRSRPKPAGEINHRDGGRGVYFEDPTATCSRSSPAPTAEARRSRRTVIWSPVW